MAYLPIGKLNLGRYLRDILGLSSAPNAMMHKSPQIVPVIDLSLELSDTAILVVTGSAAGAGVSTFADLGVPEGERWEILSCTFATSANNISNITLFDVSSGTGLVFTFTAAGFKDMNLELKGAILKKGYGFTCVASAACSIYCYMMVRKMKV